MNGKDSLVSFNSQNESNYKVDFEKNHRTTSYNFGRFRGCEFSHRRKLIWFMYFLCVGATIYLIIDSNLRFTNVKHFIVNRQTISSDIFKKSENDSVNLSNTTMTILPSELNLDTTIATSSTSDLPVTILALNIPVSTTTVQNMSSSFSTNVGIVKLTSESTPITITTTLTTPSVIEKLTHVTEDETIGCHLPNLKPFDPSVIEFVEQPSKIKCKSKRSPTLFKTDLNSNLIILKNLSEYGLSNCCYKDLIRVEFSEESTKFSDECVPITKNITKIRPSSEHIGVFCDKILKIINHTSKNITTDKLIPGKLIDMFGLIPIKPDVEERIKKVGSKFKDPLNVVILGLDGMSHMNFIRTMPKTFTYINDTLGGIGMNGYVKIGDNTFPNLVPVLMGFNTTEIETICWDDPEKEFDDCPFIWKNYSAHGFRTSYGEDAAWMSTFNYVKRGFKNPPTDYYLRTLLYAQEEMIGHVKPNFANICYGPRLAMKVLLDNMEKMAVRPELRPYFQFLWANTLSHDDLNTPMLADTHVFKTLTWLNKEGHLNNTIFILMSDHGIRWGDIRATSQGKIEERMPFVYFVFPKWFSGKYRSAISNLKLNRDRLTTHFDLHETLIDLVDPESTILDNKIKYRHAILRKEDSASAPPRGISLFLPIPPERTCDMAGISEHFCVCHTMVKIETDEEIVQYAAQYIIESLNTMLEKYSHCAQLKLSRILNAEMVESENEELNNSTDTTDTMSVTLETVPGSAIFETTLNREIDNSWVVVGAISRTNMYGNQSHCVSDFTMKKYCYC